MSRANPNEKTLLVTLDADNVACLFQSPITYDLCSNMTWDPINIAIQHVDWGKAVYAKEVTYGLFLEPIHLIKIFDTPNTGTIIKDREDTWWE